MKLKILKGTNDYGEKVIEISTEQSKIVVGFGEEFGTGDILDPVNPVFDGLTTGVPSYDAAFILRNPENCNLAKFILKEIPIYLEKRIKQIYDTCADFGNLRKIQNLKEIYSLHSIKIKDMDITYFLIDPSNATTSMLLIKSGGESVLVSGDFRNFDENWGKEKLEEALTIIGRVDYWFIEGKYFGRYAPENSSMESASIKLKNIMKFYRQVFVLQSETDLMTTKLFYNVAMKTRRIFIENTLLANLTTNTNGSSPNPVTSKKVYTYNPLKFDDKDFEFKKKYVSPFYIHSGHQKMKKEKYVLNINEKMLQDMQVFFKEDIMYDGCIILAMNKKMLKRKSIEEFIIFMKDMDLDYYELYTTGQVNYTFLNEISMRITPKKVLPINIDEEHGQIGNIYNFQIPTADEIK